MRERAPSLTGEGRVGSLIGGTWRVGECLGKGSAASVYEAVDGRGAVVALKVLHPVLSRDRELRARFLREAKVATLVGHPAVVEVRGHTTTDDGCAVLVLERLVGETLASRAERSGGVLDQATVLPILDTVLDVLVAAHAAGVVHRDIKPDNIFLTEDARVKILDFGLARFKDHAAGTEQTAMGVTIGTPDFMAPEQALGRSEAVGPASDLFSVAAMAHVLLTGKPLHDGATLVDQLMARSTQKAGPLAALVPTLPREVARILDKALELEPSARPSSALAMQLALREAAAGTALASLIPSARALPDRSSFKIPTPSMARLELGDDSMVLAMRSSGPVRAITKRSTGRHAIVAVLLVLVAVASALVTTWLLGRR